jgi:thiol-disulfide isomerase/thioredoxin
VIAGLVVSACALVAASAFGFTWRARNGRVRATAPQEAALSAATTVARGPATWLAAPSGSPQAGISAGDIGTPFGSRATLVQFSSAFCAPCRATRRILSDVSAMVDGVSYVEIDAESRLDLVRKYGVMRTPTTFVLGPAGEITHRASGQPRKADVIAALGVVI